jgi:hypothetical protein
MARAHLPKSGYSRKPRRMLHVWASRMDLVPGQLFVYSARASHRENSSRSSFRSPTTRCVAAVTSHGRVGGRFCGDPWVRLRRVSIRVQRGEGGWHLVATPPDVHQQETGTAATPTEALETLRSWGCRSRASTAALDLADPEWRSLHNAEVRRRQGNESRTPASE